MTPPTEAQYEVERLREADAEQRVDAELAEMSIEELREQVAELTEERDRLAEHLEHIGAWDEGYLGTHGGGNIEWWHDYIRSVVGRIQEVARDALQESTSPTRLPSPAEYATLMEACGIALEYMDHIIDDPDVEDESFEAQRTIKSAIAAHKAQPTQEPDHA